MNSINHQAASTVLGQLEQCRELALGDASNYEKIVPAVLSNTGASNPLDQRRWCAEFLAETFASPVLAIESKQKLSITVLDALRQNLEAPKEDNSILKNTVQIATSIYPLIFKHAIYHPNDAHNWQKMVTIKTNILRRMDKSLAGIRVCCIKFIQRVVQVQTSGIITDPRRPEHNDLSLALVPARHPLIVSANLEAEASGLLDRLLNVFQQASTDALYVTATLNCLGVLIRTRASIANKILQAILNFDPLRHEGPITAQQRVNMKSKERTVKAFLINLNKRNPNHPLAGRVHGYLTKLHQKRVEIMDSKRKFTATEPTDGLDAEKRQKLGAETGPRPLPPGNVSIAQIFTLTDDPSAANFDVTRMSVNFISQLLVPLVNAADGDAIQAAVDVSPSSMPDTQFLEMNVEVVRGRWEDLLTRDKQLKEQEAQANAAYDANSNAARAVTSPQADGVVANAPLVVDLPDVKIAPLKLPFPPTFTVAQRQTYMDEKYNDMLARVSEYEAENKKIPDVNLNVAYSNRVGLHKIAAQFMIRAATHPTARSDDPGDLGSESDRCRERLFGWIMQDWRKRLEIATEWMQAEWDAETFGASRIGIKDPIKNCYKWQCRLLDAMMPYVDGKDKKIIHFFGEVMLIDTPFLDRIRKMADDPDRAQLAVQICLYLIMYRPPVKEMCLDVVEALYVNNAAAKTPAMKILQKHRPAAVRDHGDEPARTETPVKAEEASQIEQPVKTEAPITAVLVERSGDERSKGG